MESWITDDSIELDPRGVTDGNLDHWLDKVRISVDMGLNDLEREEAQSVRDIRFQQFTIHWEGVAAGPRQDFESRFQQMVEMAPGLVDDLMARAVLRRVMERHDVATGRGDQMIDEFSKSQQLRDMPHFVLWSSLMAAYAVEVGEEHASKLKPSLYFDFVGISSYLPYCDAIFVDRECARLLEAASENRVIPWETRIFTIDTKAEFLEYLEEIEEAAPDGHSEIVDRVYGPNWLKPFWEIYTWRD